MCYKIPHACIGIEVAVIDSNYAIFQSAPVCDSQLTFTSLDTRASGHIIGTRNLTDVVTFTCGCLMLNQRYNITVIATNIKGQTTSSFTLSEYYSYSLGWRITFSLMFYLAGLHPPLLEYLARQPN